MDLTKDVHVNNCNNHQKCDNAENDLQPFLQLTTEDDGIEAALLETGGTVLAMVMMVVMMLFCHIISRY